MVKEGTVYLRIAEIYQPPMEKQSIKIQLSRRRWATIHNLYAAPIRGQDTLVLAPTEPGNLFLAEGDISASRSRSVTDTWLSSQRRPSWPSSTTPRHSAVSGGKACLSEQLTKASRFHMHSGCATSSPTEKPKCRSTETEADSYHYARDSLKDPSCRRSSSCRTLTIFGESYPKTWRWPW